jgi:hypothetical protein
MSFEDFLAEVKKNPVDQTRTWKENYAEVVITKDVLGPLTSLFDSYFGRPLKPPGESASKDAGNYSKAYGGVEKNQTLYFRKNGNGHELAMLWPWTDEASITVKIIRDK